MTLEEETKMLKSIDIDGLDKILDKLEKEIDTPEIWITWEDAKKD